MLGFVAEQDYKYINQRNKECRISIVETIKPKQFRYCGHICRIEENKRVLESTQKKKVGKTKDELGALV